jgi:hypothetical protein
MKKCDKCGFGKTWSGSSIGCPFQSSDTFGDNWNCGAINKIRDLCDYACEKEDYRLHYQYCEDQKYCTINTFVVDDAVGWEDPKEITALGLCLFVSWYKSRGRTEAMWLLDEDKIPRKPTLEDLKRITDYYTKEGLLKP